MIGMNAALNRPAEFKVHVAGALNTGCTPIALEVFQERGISISR